MSHIELNYAERIRDMGYRLTPQREIILDTLCQVKGFATINTLYHHLQQKSAAIDLSTLYRTLKFFQELHLVVTAEIEGEMMYDLAPAEPTHHLICRTCGKVQTIAGNHLAELENHLRQEHHFAADFTHLTITGLCAMCQSGP